MGTELLWFGTSTVRGVPLVGRRSRTKLLYAPGELAADEREAVAQFLSVRLCRRPSRSRYHKEDGRDCLMRCCLAQPPKLFLPGALRVGLGQRDERQCGACVLAIQESALIFVCKVCCTLRRGPSCEPCRGVPCERARMPNRESGRDIHRKPCCLPCRGPCRRPCGMPWRTPVRTLACMAGSSLRRMRARVQR